MNKASFSGICLGAFRFGSVFFLGLSLLSCKRSAPTGAPPFCALPSSISLPIELSAQEHDNWCWAASGNMVMKNLGQDVQQCTQVSDELNGAPCCPSDQAGNSCDTGGWPEFEKHHISFLRTTDAALTLEDLRKQLGCRKQPVAFTWKWVGGGGHMMVAIGYSTTDLGTLIEINDPWQPHIGSHRTISYDEYVSAANNHDHWDDFYNFAKD